MKKKNITKDDLDIMFEKYPPNKWTELAFKYFSKETDKKDMAPRKIISGVLMAFFLTGLLGTIFEASRALIGTVTFIYVGLLLALVLFMFIGSKMNNHRISKIRAELGLSVQEFNALVDKYY